MGKEEHASLLHVAAEEPSHRSKNVPRMFAYNFLDGAAFSVWQAQVLQVLVYQLSGNTAVGWISGVAGGTQVVAALVAGYAADVLERHVVCRAAALCGLLGVITSLYAVHALDVPLFFISGGIWGVYMGLANSSSEALFADSIRSGQRAKIYNLKWIVQILCWCVGYVVCLAMFLKLGDTWDTGTMQTVLYSGLALHPAALLVLSTLSDKNSLKNDVSVADQAKAESEAKVEEPTVQDEMKRLSTLDGSGAVESSSCLSRIFDWNSVPYFVCSGDFVMALGSGMTLRFIPLFFVNDYNVGPSLLMGVFIIISVVTSLCAVVVRFLADRYLGRLPSILAIRILGTSLLMYMAVVPQDTPAARLAVMLVVFIVRNSCMNCTLGMSRSVIMDCVNKNSRAKWAAVESFSNFTWAGSATLGGYLADAHGYKYTFLITAVLHFFGCSLLIPAWRSSRKLEAVVMKRSRERREKEKAEKVPKATKSSGVKSNRSLSTKAERSYSGLDGVQTTIQDDDE